MTRGRRGASGRDRPDAPRSAASGWPAPDQPKERPLDETAARDLCIKLLSARPRTRAELATALRRRGFPDEVVDGVLDRYTEVGIIDDDAFARAWVTSRHHSRGLARRALAGELHRKGVAGDTVGEAVAELDPDTEEATARALVTRRLRTERFDAGDPARTAAADRRLVGMLARKGYPAGLAYRVVREALADIPETTEFSQLIDDSVDDGTIG